MTQGGVTGSAIVEGMTRRGAQELSARDHRELLRPYRDSRFRDDVQGMRALGALLILIFHLWVHKVSGGVDVFFVVSGYLMGGVLLRQAASREGLRPLQFWASVVKRVAPAAYLVLLCTVLFGYLYIPAPFWRTVIDDLLFSALQLENLYLMRSGVSYLDSQSPPGPFQQFWALSMQMHFYLLLPLLLAPALWLMRRCGTRLPLFLVIGGLALLSFAYGLWATQENPARAYFNTPARLWEFLAGTLLALTLPLLRPPAPGLCRSLSLLGLALLLGTGLLPREAAFPGVAALLPVLASALLLYGGTRRDGSLVQRLLSARQLVYLGGVSFTLYLWHWPLLVFMRHLHGGERVSLPQGLLISGLALLLAIFTSLLVEGPARRIPRNQASRAFTLGVLCLLPVFALWVVGKHLILDTLRAAERERVAAGFFAGAGISLQDNARDVPLARFMGVKRDISPAARETCDRGMLSAEIILCTFGDLEATPLVALVGGSHASQWEPAFSEIGRRYGFRLVTISMSACSLGYQPIAARSIDCQRWNAGLLPVLAALRPDVLITTATRSDPPGQAPAVEFVPDGLVTSLEGILALGIPVIGIRDNPWFVRDPNACVWQNPARASRCARSRHEVLLAENPAHALQQQLPGFHALDLNHLLCAGDRCPAYFDGHLIWRDRSHLTRSFVHYMAAAVQAALEAQAPVLPRRAP
ncbi:MAG TPA: acyltransferase family protein [Pseudomonas sp.]|nr:acyltransferase family protein [Pseudomonas sp.]